MLKVTESLEAHPPSRTRASVPIPIIFFIKQEKQNG
jgi:hypothetical protein